MNWNKESYLKKVIPQGVTYDDPALLKQVLTELNTLPPLVTGAEIDILKSQLKEAQQGRMFILQGGDCGEQFNDCNSQQIGNKFKILLQMSVILIYGLKKPIIRVGRIAGQYAKPRSQEWEMHNDQKLLSYRGDIINSPEFTEAARRPDPKRMLEAYFRSSATLNHLRALLESGFADFHHPENWELGFMEEGEGVQAYHGILGEISDSIHFFEAILKGDSLARVKLYSSHEALHLPYEAALTRKSEEGRFYNLGTHFPWIGMRTLQQDGAHIEYLRGINNPIGIKVGPSADFDALCRIIEVLNPTGEMGKIMLIHRFGAAEVDTKLPQLLKHVKTRGLPVLLSVDPMHGNTKTTESKIKTRYFADILKEIQSAFRIHHECDIPLSGIHFELTGDNVTECIGGVSNLKEADLPRAYKSLVDPRLNYEQAMEIALAIAKMH